MAVFGAGAPSGNGVSPGHAGDPGVDAVVGLHSHHDGSLRGRSRHARAPDGAAPAANSAPIARRARRSTARARRGLRAPARDRGRSPTLDDPLRPTRCRQDHARAHRGRDHRRSVRGALRRFGARRRRPGRAPAGTRPARSQCDPDDPVSRRDPPLQQGPAGCAPTRRRERPADADRRDDREPVLRGQRRPALTLRRGRAGASIGRRDRVRRRSRGCRARHRASPPTSPAPSPARPGETRGARCRRSSSPGRPPQRSAHRSRRAMSPTPPASARCATTGRATSTTTSSRRSSSPCAVVIPMRPSTTSPRCSRAARMRASSPGEWSFSPPRTSGTPIREHSS